MSLFDPFSTFREGEEVLKSFLSDTKNQSRMTEIIDLMVTTLRRGGKIYTCGNGGSLCDASHFAEELTGRFIKDRRPLPAFAMNDSAHLTCTANDYGYDHVFERITEAFMDSKDLLLAISTSGNSKNVELAASKAISKGAPVVALLGKEGGIIKTLTPYHLIVPSHTTARIQELHIKIIHTLIEGIERKIFPDLYT